MPHFDLVIFDCDGVLVDSESLTVAVYLNTLKRYEIDITERFFFERLVGRSFDQAVVAIRDETGKAPPSDFKEALRVALFDRFERDLKPIKGIENLLQKLTTKICVATSSDPVRAAHSLSTTKLDAYFGPNVFSATMVKHGKPAPDLFLHAAQRLNVKPERCVVIEDSAFGLIAAKSAGMSAWHFTGGSHFEAGYGVDDAIARDASFPDMAALLMAASELKLT